MKIVHICISGPFIDNWGYQPNLLTRYLQNLGVQNYIVASANDFPSYLDSKIKESIVAKGNNYDLNGVNVRRIPTKMVSSSFIITQKLERTLDDIQPDVIFHHNLNCTSLPIAARYAKKHKVLMMVDNHADTINMSKNKIWSWFYYRFLIGTACRIYNKQISRAYGVTHARCDFLHEYYGVSRDKIDFLPIGADVEMADKIGSLKSLKTKYGIQDDSFIVVSGGKMGKGKGTDNLIAAIDELQAQYPEIKLLLFGKFEDEMTETQANNSHFVTVFGWCGRMQTLELLKIADVACWPIHHTTLIEDAVAVSTPVINRKTATSEHLIDENGFWIRNGSKEEIKEALVKMLTLNEQQRKQMLLACENMKQKISYRTISKKLLDDINKLL